jgi:hypothetical protein
VQQDKKRKAITYHDNIIAATTIVALMLPQEVNIYKITYIFLSNNAKTFKISKIAETTMPQLIEEKKKSDVNLLITLKVTLNKVNNNLEN